jgi:peroxiredoxin
MGRRLTSWVRKLLFYGLIFALAGVVGNVWMTRNQAAGEAPVFTLENLQGEKLAVSYHPYDGPVLLYFFADWCPICKFQNGAISSIAEDYSVLAVAMQSGNNESLRQYAEKHELKFPILNDHTGFVSRSYGVYGVPASFVIDNDGTIRYSTRGYTPSISLRARMWLSQILDS